MNVVLFRNSDDFRTITAARQTLGGFNTIRDCETFIVIPSPAYSSILNHELVHNFVRHYLSTAPTWLNEGLAEFYSKITGEKDSVTFGFVQDQRYYSKRFPSVQKLLRMTPREFYDSTENVYDHYAASALLVHMLNCDNAADRARFVSYIAALAQGVPDEQAWQSSFHDVSLDTLDHRLRRYAEQKLLNGWRTSVTVPSIELGGETIMREVEVRLLWIQITDWSTPTAKTWIAAQLVRARQDAPNSPVLEYWLGRYAQQWGSRAEAREHYERAARAAPDVARNWMALASIEMADFNQKPFEERQPGPALDHLRRLAHTADEFNHVALYLAWLHRPKEAAPFAVHAIEKMPGCYYCHHNMALLLRQKGAFARATEEERLAINLVPEGLAEIRRVYQERLREYEQLAREAPTPLTAPPTPPAGREAPTSSEAKTPPD
jgi:tetratricopeptide (TPR) repeat protein